MDNELNQAKFYKEQELFIESAKRFCQAELAPNLRLWEEASFFPDEVFRSLGAQGFLGILIPEDFGGIGGDYRSACAWCETFGELCDVGMTTAVNMHSLVIAHAIAKDGSQEIKQQWLPGAASGEQIGAYAFTEPGAGSDLATLRTSATRSSNGWILNGSKTFITNGSRSDFVLVLARTDSDAGFKGFTTFVVDSSLKGFKVARTLDKVGWRSSDTAELVFENLEIPESAVLGEVGAGWFQAAANLNWERLMLTFLSVAGARACLQSTAKYALERSTFGKAIAKHHAIGEMLSEMKMRVIRGENMTRACLVALEDGEDPRAQIAATKRLVCEDAVWVADRALQIHGGYGYTREFEPERWWRDLRLMPIGGGTSEIMASIVAKEIWGKGRA